MTQLVAVLVTPGYREDQRREERTRSTTTLRLSRPKSDLTNGEVPLDNNASERELRRQALGRKNFMFLGTDEGGAVNATFTSLLASCEMHKVPPLAYLRDVFCLMSVWQASGADLLELTPANWAVTSQRPDVIALLEANHFRRAGLG